MLPLIWFWYHGNTGFTGHIQKSSSLLSLNILRNSDVTINKSTTCKILEKLALSCPRLLFFNMYFICVPVLFIIYLFKNFHLLFKTLMYIWLMKITISRTTLSLLWSLSQYVYFLGCCSYERVVYITVNHRTSIQLMLNKWCSNQCKTV